PGRLPARSRSGCRAYPRRRDVSRPLSEFVSPLQSFGGRSVMPTVNVRYMVDDVEAALAFYTTHLGFTLISKTLPAFADVARGDLRLLLSGPASSAGRQMRERR